MGETQNQPFQLEQQQRVITGGLEMPVMGAPVLLAIDRDLGAVHVQHYPSGQIDGFHTGDQLPIERGWIGEVVYPRPQFRLE